MGVILQARMNSNRLYGKVLRPVNGKSLLTYILEKLAVCQVKLQIIVATSEEETDLPIQKFCEDYGVSCFRGALNDVADRFIKAALHYGFDNCVRINADSPLLDYQLVDKAVAIFNHGEFDLVTNVFPRSYPKGFSVEVFQLAALQRAYASMKTDPEREHVTLHFYQHPEQFRIKNFSFERDCSSYQLSVDTLDDFNLFSAMVASMTKPHWQYRLPEVLNLVEEVRNRL